MDNIDDGIDPAVGVGSGFGSGVCLPGAVHQEQVLISPGSEVDLGRPIAIAASAERRDVGFQSLKSPERNTSLAGAALREKRI